MHIKMEKAKVFFLVCRIFVFLVSTDENDGDGYSNHF